MFLKFIYPWNPLFMALMSGLTEDSWILIYASAFSLKLVV